MKAMIEAGASGVHFEDRLSSAKKCGHLGGKVLVPTREAIQKLVAARLAADVCGVSTVLIARTDANAANLLTADTDENDQPFTTGEKTVEGFCVVRSWIEQVITGGLSSVAALKGSTEEEQFDEIIVGKEKIDVTV
jgi:isocitrate lyase